MTDRRDLLRKVPLFTGLTDGVLGTIAERASEVRFADGETLAHEGETGESFYVLIDGRARVDRRGNEVRHLAAGDFLGEISLVDGRPRTATVTAEGDTRALALGREAFLELFDRIPVFRLGILMALTERLRRDAPDVVD